MDAAVAEAIVALAMRARMERRSFVGISLAPGVTARALSDDDDTVFVSVRPCNRETMEEARRKLCVKLGASAHVHFSELQVGMGILISFF